MTKRMFIVIAALFATLTWSQVWAQTTTTGELSGIVTDPTGAVVPNADVTLRSLETGSVANATTAGDGGYKFAYLQPGNYSVKVTAQGFQSTEQQVRVALGASAASNFKLPLATGTTTVEVNGAPPALETQDANLTANFNSKQVELLPNPGNDLSAVALTAPGVVMNTAGGSMFGGGNFEVNGLPATSNLFTLDGSNDNDPYFNVNNTGATNLSLGLNDIQESTVVSSGYSGSYGGLAGANVNYVSKSGTNAFHGNVEYWWNGDVLNANNYFRNQQNALAGSNVAPRPFVNANQYAGSVGGPIKKDKAFFFFDVEGLYLAIPSLVPVNLPTPAFQSAVLGNLATNGLSSSIPFYNTMFGQYNRLSQAGATALPGGGCSDVTTIGAVAFGAGNPCAVQIQAGLTAHTHDNLYVGRYDQNIGNNDRMFIRVEKEHGLQATYTDPINPAFNGVSDQPQWQSQFSETHTFGTNKVNDFKASLLWYSAGFAEQNQAAANSAFPFASGTATLAFADSSLSPLNGDNAVFPQGRNITQYQFVDDFSWVKGRHDFKFGVNFRRNDISDQNFVFVTPLVEEFSLSDFVSGGGGTSGNIIVQNFPSRTEVPISLYQLGLYAADDVRVTKDLKLTLSLRADHLSNPVCQIDCFQRFASGGFGDTGAPVNASVLANQNQAFPSVTNIVWQPKIGFAWSPRGSDKTVLRGGVGIFGDSLPTGAIDSFLQQAPLDPGFNTFFGYLSPSQTGPLGNLNQLSQAANASFVANYASGGPVTPFNFFNSTAVKVPVYYKWSLELQQAVGWNTTMNISYIGNHGSHEQISNGALNAYCCSAANGFPFASFANLPTSIPDGRFGQVSESLNVANSNYNGMTITANHHFMGGFQFQASYTWSHALDEISNNSLSPFGLNTTGLYADVIFPENPYNIRQFNYGNADYDIRHNFTMNYVWSDAFRHLTSWGPNSLMKGWSFSGTIFKHTGLPFTVFDNNYTTALQTTNYGGGAQYIFADQLGPSGINCGAQAATVNAAGVPNSCFGGTTGGLFADPGTTYPDQRRNQFRGPGYFDTDFAVEKGFGIPKWENAQFSLGARFFNLFNHPDFYFPVMNFNSPQFGQILQTVSTPTSIYGSGLGADASPRIIQLQAKLTF